MNKPVYSVGPCKSGEKKTLVVRERNVTSVPATLLPLCQNLFHSPSPSQSALFNLRATLPTLRSPDELWVDARVEMANQMTVVVVWRYPADEREKQINPLATVGAKWAPFKIYFPDTL